MHFLDPQKVLPQFTLEEGMHVAEIHAGSGHFTPLIKKKVGTYGVVHPLIHADGEDHLELPEKVDRVLAINVPSANMHAVYSKAYRILKPQGKMIAIDKKVDYESEAQAIHLAGLAGFNKERSFNAGNDHFGLVFKKS